MAITDNRRSKIVYCQKKVIDRHILKRKKHMKKIINAIIVSLMSLSVLQPVMAEEENGESTVYRHPTYGISYTNIKATSAWTDRNYVVRTTTIAGGGHSSYTVSYSKTTSLSVSTEYSAIKQFNATLGVSSSETVTQTDTIAYSCPSKYNSCTITIYPKYQNYSYDRTLYGNYYDSGTASVLSGLTQTVTKN